MVELPPRARDQDARATVRWQTVISLGRPRDVWTLTTLSLVIITSAAVVHSRREVAAAAEESYHAVSPQRLLDTRISFGVADTSRTTPGVPTPIVLPASATGSAAVALNLTVAEANVDGFASAYPCGQEPPLASNVNFRPGQPFPTW